jgi:hypothetical protein
VEAGPDRTLALVHTAAGTPAGGGTEVGSPGEGEAEVGVGAGVVGVGVGVAGLVGFTVGGTVGLAVAEPDPDPVGAGCGLGHRLCRWHDAD